MAVIGTPHAEEHQHITKIHSKRVSNLYLYLKDISFLKHVNLSVFIPDRTVCIATQGLTLLNPKIIVKWFVHFVIISDWTDANALPNTSKHSQTSNRAIANAKCKRGGRAHPQICKQRLLPAVLRNLVGRFFGGGFRGGKLCGKFGGNFVGLFRTHKIDLLL